MDVFANLALGFEVAASLQNLLYCFLGVTLGTLIGVLPGVGPLVTISVLLPLTFGLPADSALIMLAGIYYGAAYGGSTTAILVNLPGESSSVVTCFDGYQMARQGRAGPALTIAAIGSLVAGCFGTMLIVLLGPPLTAVALAFGPADYFSLMLAAMILTAALASGSLLVTTNMALLGALFGMVGSDINTGVARLTFGLFELADGIDFSIVAMGLFAIAEIVRNLESQDTGEVSTIRITRFMPNRDEWKAASMPIARGTLIGSFFGILPGTGQTVSSFAAYIVEKRLARDPSRFGNGAIEGVAAPEAANNAAAQTSFIPTLSLGIPGSATMALMMGALLIQGIFPGPQIITQHPDLFWGLIVSMWIGNVMLVILNLPLVGVWVQLVRVPYRWLYPLILVFCCVGTYSLHYARVDIYVMAVFGALGYIFYLLKCEPAPFILGFVLGPMLEENFRRALLLSGGNPATFVLEPISAACLVVCAIVVAVMLLPSITRQKDRAIKE